MLLVWSLQAVARDLPEGFNAGWSTFLQGGYVHRFDTDIDDSGRFSIDRFFFQGGASYTPDPLKSLTLSLAYGREGYDFSGDTGFAGLRPWDDIDSWQVNAPIRWGLDRYWTLFAIPTLRATAESGADLGDGLSGGGLLGLSYRFSDRLTLGPGIGVLSQIEDDASVFPVLLINWSITDWLSLETGGGLAATRGPGLTLNWRASDRLGLFLGGRYEKQRFRLDGTGTAPEGVGEYSSIPVFFGVNYNLSRNAQARLVGGVELDGELRLEDRNGEPIAHEDYDNAGFAGLTFNLQF